MNTVRFGQQVLTPSKIVCIARNFTEHIEELNNLPSSEMVIFTKPNSAISNQLSVVLDEPVDFESELSFLYEDGRFCAVALGFDLTKRRLQGKLKKDGLPWDRAKSFDRSAVFSDFVEYNDKLSDLEFELYINGSQSQFGRVSEMLYSPSEILTEISTFMTLVNGDVVMTGTPKGVGLIQVNDRLVGTIKENDKVILKSHWTVTYSPAE